MENGSIDTVKVAKVQISTIIDQYQPYSYLNKLNLLMENQSGFRNGYSCETCLTNTTNIWNDAINKKCIIGCVALDLSKVFDLLNIDIIIKKLEAYGCNNVSLKWFHSYLTNRIQYVKVDHNHKSNMLPICHGVPQGSI